MPDPAIQVRKLNVSFGNSDISVQALDSLEFDIFQGEFFCIIGPNGCGKTTLINSIAGFVAPTSGSILVNGRKVVSPGPDRAVVFQEFALFDWKTVRENIEFGLKALGIDHIRRSTICENYTKIFNLNGFENTYPRQLSGGMKQKVALARALAVDPEILLMDEPLSSLDAQTRELLQEEIMAISGKTFKTMVMVTHSIDEAIFLANRVLIMTQRPGRVKEILSIPVPRPREAEFRISAEFQKLKSHIWYSLREEIAKT